MLVAKDDGAAGNIVPFSIFKYSKCTQVRLKTKKLHWWVGTHMWVMRMFFTGSQSVRLKKRFQLNHIL